MLIRAPGADSSKTTLNNSLKGKMTSVSLQDSALNTPQTWLSFSQARATDVIQYLSFFKKEFFGRPSFHLTVAQIIFSAIISYCSLEDRRANFNTSGPIWY